MTTNEGKKQALIDALSRVFKEHGVLLDKYVDHQDSEKVEYLLKIVGQQDVYLTIEEAFGPGIYHGPPRPK